MPRASPNGVLLMSMAGMAVVLCAALVVTMEYAKTEIRARRSEAADKPAAAPDPFAARIKELNHHEYAVTQQGEDDHPYTGRYVRATEPGLYLDVVSGEALFSSLDKLEPMHGYAEFAKPLDPAGVLEEDAVVTGVQRVNVRSKAAHSYLGWIEKEEDSGKRRYVVNSSALSFVPAAELEQHGLGQHRGLFPDALPAAPK